MDQRVWAALAVSLRASGRHKAEMFVKSHRLLILFVHLGRKVRVKIKRVLDQGLPNALSSACRVDEESIHMSVIEQHETERFVVSIGGKPKWRTR